MTPELFEHKPVMFDEVMGVFEAVGPGILIDGTLGAGGHSYGFLSRNPSIKVLGLDRDPAAIAAASGRLSQFSGRFRAVHADFDDFSHALDEACQTDSGFCDSLMSMFLDLGVSSPQLDRSERGFSYRLEGPLDMRMDPTKGASLEEVLAQISPSELASLLRANGESRFAMRIAKAILGHAPYRSTTQLAEVIKTAIPAAARRTGGHPATRVFQALRIRVNNELEKLQQTLTKAFEAVVPGGRLAVISYHSGEDSIVKALFREQVSGGCTCPARLGCVCGAVPKAKFVVRSKAPTDEEIARNPRARSARLRAIEFIGMGVVEDDTVG